jgi:hypothetical protein
MKWKSVVGREGQYEVSDNGDLRKVGGIPVGQWANDQGYKLARFSKPRQTVRVHRVVAEAFIKNPLQRPFINHIDCARGNNVSSNLEWCSQWENLNHSDRLGRMQRNYWKGKRSPNAQVSPETIQKVREEYKKGNISWEALGKRHGISKRSIGRIVREQTYV